MIIRIIDIKPKAGSPLIHSMSESFSEEEVDIEDEVMRNWINHFKMQFHQLHASGHMSRDQLVDTVKGIAPKKAFPVHTENQQLFMTYYNKVQTIEYGKSYIV